MKKRICSFAAALLLIFTLVFSAFAAGTTVTKSSKIPSKRLLPRVVDNAGLLSENDKKELTKKLDEIAERQQFEVAVVTVKDLEGKTPEAYADDFYDYNGYGFGENKDGMLLLISMADRDWHITTTGYGETVLTKDGLNYMSEKFKPALSSGNYYKAFTQYAELCDKFVTQAKTGKPYTRRNLPKKPLPNNYALTSVAVGIVAAFIVVGVMKKKLKSVHLKAEANDYIRQGSFNLMRQNDRFLYSTVSKTEKPKDNDNGSGGHYGSSGTHHGGGGGKF